MKSEVGLPTILLLEDEPHLGSTLEDFLNSRGHFTQWVTSIQQARQALSQPHRFQLLILDVTLPDGNGFDFAASLLDRKGFAIPFVFLTAHGNPEDRLHGFEIGASDFITKPFHLKELVIRIENLLQRNQFTISLPHQAQGDGSVQVGDAQVFFSELRIERQGQSSPLSPKEAALLRLLFENRGKIVSRDEILNRVWSVDEFPTSRTVDNFIVRLRRMIGDQADQPQWIRTVRGIGYQLK